ncbi:sorting nexin 1 [Hanseniaspora uvarum]|nr:sorting nexin 1 [Hanseniaspora uvarum]
MNYNIFDESDNEILEDAWKDPLENDNHSINREDSDYEYNKVSDNDNNSYTEEFNISTVESDNNSVKQILNEIISENDNSKSFLNIEDDKINKDISIEENIFNDANDVNIFEDLPTDDSPIETSFTRTKSSLKKNLKKTHGLHIQKLYNKEKNNNETKVDILAIEEPKKMASAELDLPIEEKLQDISINTTPSTPVKPKKTIIDLPKPEPVLLTSDPVHIIELSDPYKVGDLTNSFIEFQITTTLSPNTILKGVKVENLIEDRTFIVKRRYSDFRWLYRQLQQSYWGYIIPSPPDKSLKNLFTISDHDKVGMKRKDLLLNMLTKIASNPHLQYDENYLEFLTNQEVQKFSEYYKIKDQETLSYAINDPLDLSEISRFSEYKLFGHEDGVNFYEEAKGMETEQFLQKKIIQALRNYGSNSSSLTKALFGFAKNVINEGVENGLPQYSEPDNYFDEAEDCWDSLFTELKNLDNVLKHLKESKEKSIKDLIELSDVLNKMETQNVSENLNKLYHSFAEVHINISDVLRRSSDIEKFIFSDYVQDQLRSLNNSTSIFNQRYKLGSILVLLEWIVKNKKIGKIVLEGESLKKWEDRYNSVKLKWREIGLVIKRQLYEFDMNRVVEFRNCIEIYIETFKEQQKELIEIWETFLETVC